MMAVPVALVALAVVLGLPQLSRFAHGPLVLALAACAALGLGFVVPPEVAELGAVSFLADGPALIGLAAGALAARALPAPLLFFVALAALSADLRLGLLALVGLLSALPVGRRRWILSAVPLLLLVAILLTPTGFTLGLPGSTRAVVQLRAFGVLGVCLPAVLLLPAAARGAGLALWVWVVVRFALPLWPEAGVFLAPILAWVAGGVALLAAGATWLRPGWAPWVLLGPALIGAFTGTSPGLMGAALLVAALLLLPTLAAAPLAVAGAALALHAGWWAIPSHHGPVLLAAAALLVAAIPLIRKAIRTERSTLALTIASALAVAPLAGVPLPGTHEAAARATRRSLAPDDVGGWRRISRPTPEPVDAGVP